MRKKVIETTEMLNKQMGDALIELLKEKPISKISIEELTKKADVGRATFFRHFDSKEDLLSYRLVEIYKEYMGDSFDASYSDIEHSIKFFNFYRDTLDLHLLLLNNNLDSVIFEGFRKVLIPLEEQSDTDSIYTTFFTAYGLFGVILKWIKNGCKENSEEMAKLCRDLLSYNNQK